MDLSIIVVNYNGERFLRECIDSILRYAAGLAYEIVVVDNASSDGSVKLLQGYPQVRLLVNEMNEGFAKGNNRGIGAASGRYVLLLNADAALLGAVRPLIEYMDRDPSVGLAGCAVYDAGGLPQLSHMRFPAFFSELYKLTVMSIKDILGYASPRPHQPAIARDADWVSGCCMLVSLDILKKTGGMDEKFFFYYEDVDLCYSIRKDLGKRVVYYPGVSIRHVGGGSAAFSDARHLCQYYTSCMTYFRKRRGALYCAAFRASCVACWCAALAVLGAINMIRNDERIAGKIEMISSALSNSMKAV